MNNGARILIVDDEPQICKLLTVSLKAQNYEIQSAATGQAAIETVAAFKPDLVLLDLGLSDMDGKEVVRRIREWSTTPIIILSARELDTEKIEALDAGADDYITKPFSTGELFARIRVALRHTTAASLEPSINFGDLSIDLAKRVVLRDQQEIRLTPTEYEILKVLATHAGKVLTHKQLLKLVWGPNYQEETQYLRVYIASLRRKIEKIPAIPKHIITESGVGYRFTDG